MSDFKNSKNINLIYNVYKEDNINKNKPKKYDSHKRRRINLSVNIYPRVKIINVECFKEYNKIMK
jgi:hypothetical protein